MRIPLIMLLIFLSGCRQKPADSAAANNIPPGENPAPIPPAVTKYLQSILPGWHVPVSSDYVKSWWSFYDRNSRPWHVIADINNDRKEDHAFILKNGDSLKVVLIISTGKSYRHYMPANFDMKFNQGRNDLQYGLGIEPPGRVDIAYPRISSLILLNNAVNMMELENRICIYHWADTTVSAFATR